MVEKDSDCLMSGRFPRQIVAVGGAWDLVGVRVQVLGYRVQGGRQFWVETDNNSTATGFGSLASSSTTHCGSVLGETKQLNREQLAPIFVQ